MFAYFEFQDGSNPYITKTNEAFFEMIRNYYTAQMIDPRSFYVYGPREWNGKPDHSRKTNRAILRHFAQEWQNNFDNCEYDYHDLAEFGEFFEEYGKKFGLLREFRENGII